jgi:large subunit ribosomal protein L25
VPLRLVGEATAVAQEGGLVDPSVDSIEVVTTPRTIPDEFVVDVSDMQMDTVIRLSDIPMPPGVSAAGDPDSPVVTVLTMRAEVAEIEAADAEVAEEQAEEGEAPAEAEAPAEGGAAEGAAAEGDDAAE